jgi:fatty acid desaturase
VHLTVIAGLAWYIVATSPPWYLAVIAAVAAGHSWACLAFLAHETLHHAVSKNPVVERLVGYCGLTLFCLSPTLWNAWHNQEHHGNTGRPGLDPDTFGTLESWHANAGDRAVEKAAPGTRTIWSAGFLFFTFSVHSLVVLFFHSRRDDYYARVSRSVVYAEFAAMVTFWPWSFVFIYVVPVLVANAIVMSYIATNHFLSSMTSINDPLVNSLTVRAPRWLEWLHLGFGYHVEHHLFPTVSARHAPVVRDAVIQLYGNRYLSLPHARALKLLYTRPKLHLTGDTLIDPRTNATFYTLAPGDLTMSSAPASHAHGALPGSFNNRRATTMR